jgi:hypothetical protein
MIKDCVYKKTLLSYFNHEEQKYGIKISNLQDGLK